MSADFGGGCGLGGVVDVGEDREIQIGFDFSEDAQAFCQSRAAKGFYRGTVGFVVGGFEDVRHAAVGGNLGRHVPPWSAREIRFR